MHIHENKKNKTIFLEVVITTQDKLKTVETESTENMIF